MGNKFFVVTMSFILGLSGCLGSETVEENSDPEVIDDTVDSDNNVTLFEGDEVGECSDLADNDQDGLFDCDDPNCSGSPLCQSNDNPCNNTGDNNTGNNTGENNTGNNTGENNTGNNTGDNNTGNNTTIDYSGNWTLQSPISYTCALGVGNVSISKFEIAEFDSNQSLENFSLNVSEINGFIRTMHGDYSNDSLEVEYSEGNPGTDCGQQYKLSGQFTNSTFVGTFEVEYFGSYCHDCTGQTWNISANLT